MAFNNVLWRPDGSLTTLLTTQLDALGNGSGSALGTEFDNGTSLWLFGDFELILATNGGMTAGASVDLFLVPATDGTNYNNGGTTSQPPNFFKGSWVTAATTDARLTIQGLPLPPCKFKAMAVNRTGVALAATTNLVKMLPYGYKVGT